MPYRPVSRTAAVAILALSGIATFVRVADAHARLLRSTPAAGAQLASAPAEVRLWFSERPELRFTSVQITDGAGRAISLGAVRAADSMSVVLPVTESVAPGSYSLTWRTAASDGHATSGKFSFSVASSPVADSTRAAASPATEPPVVTITPGRRHVESNAVVQPAQVTTFSTAMRWAELVAMLSMIGMVVFRLAILPGAELSPASVGDANDRALRLARALAILYIVGTLTRAFAQAELIAGADSRMHALATLVRESHWGAGWALGAFGIVVALVGLLAASRSLWGWSIAGVGLVLMTASESYTGHAGASAHLPLAIASDVAHQLGGGGWLGGLVAVLICGLPALRRESGVLSRNEAEQLLRSYHTSATECVIIVVATALISAWLRLPTVAALWTSSYGRILLLKIALVIVVMGFGLFHWRQFVERDWDEDSAFRFRRTAAGELLFGALIVAATAVLIATPIT